MTPRAAPASPPAAAVLGGRRPGRRQAGAPAGRRRPPDRGRAAAGREGLGQVDAGPGPGRAAARAAPFVELPLGATEDRVVGTLDLAAALHRRRACGSRPGLLAAADGGVLYVDEINLLPDHLVDVLLDVAASGVNRVERDGVSHVHASRFVLIGSMNPEEGDLRPQLLDRFGLAVEVRAGRRPGRAGGGGAAPAGVRRRTRPAGRRRGRRRGGGAGAARLADGPAGVVATSWSKRCRRCARPWGPRASAPT